VYTTSELTTVARSTTTGFAPFFAFFCGLAFAAAFAAFVFSCFAIVTSQNIPDAKRVYEKALMPDSVSAGPESNRPRVASLTQR
jgi:hypothetical protein